MAAAGRDGRSGRGRRAGADDRLEPAAPQRAVPRRVRCRPEGAGPRAALRAVPAADRAARRRSLADVAAECGYADQAHMAREWQALAGCQPDRVAGGRTAPIRPRRSTATTAHMVGMSDHPSTDRLALPQLPRRAGRRSPSWPRRSASIETLAVPGETDDVIVHAELRWPEGGGVMLGSADRPDSEFSQLPTGCASLYVVTDDPDAVYERAIAAGAKVVREMRDEDYGSTRLQRPRPGGQHLELRHLPRGGRRRPDAQDPGRWGSGSRSRSSLEVGGVVEAAQDPAAAEGDEVGDRAVVGADERERAAASPVARASTSPMAPPWLNTATRWSGWAATMRSSRRGSGRAKSLGRLGAGDHVPALAR